MAKKLSKKKSSKSSNKKKSFFDSLLSFRKILVYSFVITFALFTYKSLLVTSQSVEGASTDSSFKYKIEMTLFKDPDADAIRQNNEGCLAKTFKVKVDGVSQSVKGNSDCTKFATPKISVRGYCHTVEYVKNSLANWTITGIKYSDSGHNGKVKVGVSSVQVCVYPPNEGLSVDYFATVNFGVKAK
jgi:hypothetical protein